MHKNVKKKDSNVEELTESIRLLQLRTPKYISVILLFIVFLIGACLVCGYFVKMEDSLELYGEVRPASERLIYSQLTGYVERIVSA